MKKLPILIVFLLIAVLFCGTAGVACASSTDDTAVSHQFRIGENCVVVTKDCAYLTKITFSKILSPFFKEGVELTITEDNISYLKRNNLVLPKVISEDNRFITIPDETVKFGVTFNAKRNNGYPLGIGKPGTFTFTLPANKTEELVAGWFWNGEWRNCPIHPLGNNRWQVEYTDLDGYYVILALEKGSINPFTGLAKVSPLLSGEKQKNTISPENESAANLSETNESFSQTNDTSGIPILLIAGIVAGVMVIGVVSVLYIRQRKTQKKNKESMDES